MSCRDQGRIVSCLRSRTRCPGTCTTPAFARPVWRASPSQASQHCAVWPANPATSARGPWSVVSGTAHTAHTAHQRPCTWPSLSHCQNRLCRCRCDGQPVAIALNIYYNKRVSVQCRVVAVAKCKAVGHRQPHTPTITANDRPPRGARPRLDLGLGCLDLGCLDLGCLEKSMKWGKVYAFFYSGSEMCFASQHLERTVLGCKTRLKSSLLAPF